MKKKIKKTSFPDLERLPPHNHFKHFLIWLGVRLLGVINHFNKVNLNKDKELEILKIKLEIKELELTILKNKIQELDHQQEIYFIK